MSFLKKAPNTLRSRIIFVRVKSAARVLLLKTSGQSEQAGDEIGSDRIGSDQSKP